jgi:hypothetical protein
VELLDAVGQCRSQGLGRAWLGQKPEDLAAIDRGDGGGHVGLTRERDPGRVRRPGGDLGEEVQLVVDEEHPGFHGLARS